MTHIFDPSWNDHRHDAHKQVILNDNKPSGQLLFRQSVLAMEAGHLFASACADALREDDLVHRACLGHAENAHQREVQHDDKQALEASPDRV